MATDFPPRRFPIDRPHVDLGLLRDLLAVLLILVGVVGVSVAAFATDWRLGLAVVSVVVIGTGAALGYER